MGDYKLLGTISRVFVWLFCAVATGNLLYYVFVRDIVLFSVDSPIVFPALLAVLLIICLIVDGYSDRRQFQGRPAEKLSGAAKREFFAVLLLFAGTLTYVLLLPKIHFLASSIIYMSIIAYVLNGKTEGVIKKILKALLSAAIFIPVLYYLFSTIFHVPLP